MIKVNTTKGIAYKKTASKIDLSKINTTPDRSKNQGGFLGGLGYVGGNIAAGLGGIVEGVIDASIAPLADLFGDHEYAEYLFKNNVVGDWHKSITEEYNPTGLVKFLGDVGHGLGQSSVLLIPYAGAPMFFQGIISQSISGAVEQTGDVGVKEAAYGFTSGAIEAGLEYVMGAAGKGAQSIGSAIAKKTSKGAVKRVTSSAVRKGLVGKVISSATGEFFEEAASEIIDVGLQKAYQINPDAKINWNDVLYAGVVGAVSGAVMGGSIEGIQTLKNRSAGQKIIRDGNAQTLVNTATAVADKLAKQGTNFKKAPEWVKTLRGEVDAYNKLVEKGQQTSASAETILGEMKASLFFAEIQSAHYGLTENIKNSSEENRATLAEYVNKSIDKNNRPRDYTAEDIANDTDGIATQLGIMQFASPTFINYADAISSLEADQAQESEIGDVVSEMQTQSAEAVETEQSLDQSADQVEDNSNIKNKSKRDLAPISRSAESIRSKQAALAEFGTTGDYSAAGFVLDDGRMIKLGQGGFLGVNHKNIERIYDNKKSSDAVNQFIQEGNVRIKASSPGIEISADVPVTISQLNTIARFVSSSLRSKGVFYLDITDADGKEFASKTYYDDDSVEDVMYDIKRYYNDNKIPAPRRYDLAPKKTPSSPKDTPSPKEQSKNEGKSATKSTDKPVIRKPKEALTDKQRVERAVKRAEKLIEWEKKTQPTTKELNTAREYIKDFDSLPPSMRTSVFKMLRSADGKVDKNTLKGVANLMTMRRRDGRLVMPDLELRFAEGIVDGGLYTHIGEGENRRVLILINSDADFKETVKGTIAHEVVHYIENRKGYRELADYVLKTAKAEKIAEIEKEYNEHYKAIYAEEAREAGLTGEAITKKVAERMATEEHRELIKSEVVAKLIGLRLNNEKFLKKYATKDDAMIKKIFRYLRATVSYLKDKDKATADEVRELVLKFDEAIKGSVTSEEKTGTAKFDYLGLTIDGRRVYQSALDKSVDIKIRKKLFQERVKMIFNLDAVELKTDIKKIKIKADKFTIKKNLQGDHYARPSEYEAKVNALYDLVDILETATYIPSATNPEDSYINPSNPPKNKAHENVKYWYKFENRIVLDGVSYTVTFNIRDKGKEQLQYLIEFKEDKTPGLSHTVHKSDLRQTDQTSYSNSIPQKSDLSTGSEKKSVTRTNSEKVQVIEESQNSAKETVFGKRDLAAKPISEKRALLSDAKYSISMAGKIAENTEKYNDKHGKVDGKSLEKGIGIMKSMASLMKYYLDKPGILPPDVIGKTAWKNGSYGRTMENTTLCIRTLTYEYFKDEVAKAIGRPLTVSESLLASQKIYDIATYPQCIYCYVAADRKSFDAFIGEYVADMDKYIKLLKDGGNDEALFEEYLHGRKPTDAQKKRWAEWKRIAKSGEKYISAADINTRSKRNELIKGGDKKIAAQVRDAQRYAQSASWAKSVSDYVAYGGDILKFSPKMVEMLNSEYGLRMYSFSDYTPAFIVENMQMVLDASVRGLKVLSYTKDADYVRIFGESGMAINMSCFARWDAKTGTYVEDSRQGMKWEEVKDLRKKYKNAGSVMVVTNDKMLDWALAQDWIDVVIPYHIVKTGTTIAGEYQWRNYTRESADYAENKTANIYPTEHNNDFKTFRKLVEERGITPRFKEWYDKAVRGEISGDTYMKLVNEVRLPASKLSPVKPSFNLEAAMSSFGVNSDGSAIEGGYVDLGGYMGNWFKKGVDVEQEVKIVAEDIESGKSVADVSYGRQSIREASKPVIKRDLAPKRKKATVDKSKLNENGEVKDEFFAEAVSRMYQNEAKRAQNTAEAYKEGNKILNKKIDTMKQQHEALVANIMELEDRVHFLESKTEAYTEGNQTLSELLSAARKRRNKAVIELEELRAELRQMGYDLEAEKRKVKRREDQIDKQKKMLKDAEREKARLEREFKLLSEVEAREIARLKKQLAKERSEIGKVYSESEIRREIKTMMESGLISKFFGGQYKPNLPMEKLNLIARYIAIELNTAGTAEGKRADALLEKAADEIVARLKFTDEDSGKKYVIRDLVDAETLEQFVDFAKTDIRDLFNNVGTINAYSELVRQYKLLEQKYNAENDKASEKAAWGKEFPKTYQAAMKVKALAEKNKGAGSDSIQFISKTLASVVDTAGHMNLTKVDEAAKAISDFLDGEIAKEEAERAQLPEGAEKTSFSWDTYEMIRSLVNEFIALRENRIGEQLTSEELKIFGDMLRAMKSTIERYNKEFVNGHWVNAEAEARESINDLNAFAAKNKEYKTKVGKFLGEKLGKTLNQLYFYNVLSPETVIEAVEGFKKDGLLKTLLHSIREAEQSSRTMAARMKDPFVQFMDNKENVWTDEKGRKHSFRNKLNDKMIKIKEREISLGEAIYLYMLTKREHSHLGLKDNGYITYNDDGSVKETIYVLDPQMTRTEIESQLDEKDKAFLKMSEAFFNETASKIKYDADMKIFGFSNNQSSYYVPIIRDRYARMNGVSDPRMGISSIITVYNKSFTQALVRNNNALEGKSIMRIIDDHADGLADYSELYLPLKAFDRLYNRRVILDDGHAMSIRQVLNQKIWNGAEGYFTDLFKDVQGQSRGETSVVDTVAGWLRSGWVNSLLGANLKVVATQTTSLAAATQVIEGKYITAALPIITPGKDVSEIGNRADKYSKIIFARHFEMGALKSQGNVDKVTDIGQKTGVLIEWMDRRVCVAIFHAAEIKVEETTGHAIGTEENAKLAAKIADKAIFTTQAMYGSTERSALQRSKSEIAKMFSMFTSDTIKQLSHLYGNTMKYLAHKERAKTDKSYEALLDGDKKEMLRSMRTLAIVGVMIGLITQGFKYLYGKEEEEPEDKVKDLAFDVAYSTLNILPVWSDVIDKLFLDYDMSVNVLDVANDTLETVSNGFKLAGKLMSGEYVSNKEIGRTAVNIGKSTFSLFGWPVAPVERTVTGLMRRFTPSAIYGYDAMFKNPSYTADLQRAVEKGDEQLAEHILGQLYRNEVAGVYTSEELEIVAYLYSKGYTNVLPQRVGETINDVKLDKKQRQQFNKIYAQASPKVMEMIATAEFKELSEEQQAKAIKNLYSLYYNRAASTVVGKEVSNAQMYSWLTGNYSALFTSQAYKSGLDVVKNDKGKEVSVRDQFVEYAQNLGLSESDLLVVKFANGVRDKKTKAAFIKHINTLTLSDEQKAVIAEKLSLEIKDGKLVEKKE